jgi:HEAT repeat protein
MRRLTTAFLAVSLVAGAQTPKDVRAVARQGSTAIPTVAQYLNSPSVDTRIEVIKQLIAIGGRDTIDPLIRGTQDADPEVQIRATDGLVNFYQPGYVRQGLGSSVVRAGASLRAKFSDTNDQVIDSFITVRPEVIVALGKLARGGASMDARANACRALGILRGQAALPDLIEALRTHDNRVMYEALVAVQKIRDPSAGPRIVYLVRDFDDRVQSAAIDAVGLLRTNEARPSLRDIVNRPRNSKSERSALASLSLMPEPQDRGLFQRFLQSKDDKLRASAGEGLARIDDPADKSVLEQLWKSEDKMLPRLAAAFGLTMEGNLDLGEDAPFRYLINTLNSVAYREVAVAYLIEAGRRPDVRKALYRPLEQGTRDEKIQLSRVLSASGDEGSVSYLEKMSRDADGDVAQEGLRALRSLRARLRI